MLSKCANPQCTAQFRYLHDGKLFRIEVPSASGNLAFANDGKKPSRRIEFFWLCTVCCAEMMLAYEEDVGVITRPRPKTTFGAVP